MRSSREISFRLQQEIRNLQLFAFPPRFKDGASSPLAGLPDPGLIAKELACTDFASQVLRLANEIVAHQFPIFGLTIETGPHIDWRRDYVNQISGGLPYFRLVPYLDASRVGDHKFIWELSRHQHLVLLAQAFLFDSRDTYLETVFRHLASWWQQNPFERGINWASALEVAFRAFSWMWVYHLIGNRMPDHLRSRFLESLYQHGCHIQNNLSFYFSPNTHLLGEAVVLHALGHFFPSFPRARDWAEIGRRTVLEQVQRQVRVDGSHFEQSTYYHVYALDMFSFHAVVSRPPAEYMDKLRRMADILHALMGAERSLPFLGDDDGGRWFHPYGPRDQFGRATLATCATLLGRDNWAFDTCDLFSQAAWWLGRTDGSAAGECTSQLFPDSGLAVLHAPGTRIIFDGGPFGPGSAGHSHSDTLSVIANASGRPILIDSGTYIYVGSKELRNALRGSAAHNTIRVDGRDQAVSVGPFRWSNLPSARILTWESDAVEDLIIAECKYDGIIHRRLVRYVKPDLVFILDSVDGPPGEHEIEQFWHLASEDEDRVFLGVAPELAEAWHSPVFGTKHPGRVLLVRRRTTLPSHFAAALVLSKSGTAEVAEQGDTARFAMNDGRVFQIDWPRIFA
ncbi:MAG: alginate lyase family protein [Acidobacteriaceae bacterium]|nr:alginate lyase family protein [Acidobacteriaceae bacterium]MBV9778535.1 alginate lyase family protein [Acidobacteriaceae bacterium]